MSGPGALSTPRPRLNLLERINMSNRTCCVAGCEKPTNQHHPECAMHHARLYRTGSYGPTQRPHFAPSTAASRGYLFTTVPMSHPLHVKPPKGGGRPIWYHRVVLFDKIGYGPHCCHWCRKPISWGKDLYADHVDANKLNNDPTNLVQSCCRCNTRRAMNLDPVPWVA